MAQSLQREPSIPDQITQLKDYLSALKSIGAVLESPLSGGMKANIEQIARLGWDEDIAELKIKDLEELRRIEDTPPSASRDIRALRKRRVKLVKDKLSILKNNGSMTGDAYFSARAALDAKIATSERLEEQLLEQSAAGIRTAPAPKKKDAVEFTHTEDFDCVGLGKYPFTLTKRRAIAIQMLHDAHEKNEPGLAESKVLDEIETSSPPRPDNLFALFRGSPIWKRLILRVSPSTYRLNVQGPCATCAKAKKQK